MPINGLPLLEMRLPSRLGVEKVAASAASALAKLLGYSDERVEDLTTAVAEACINAIEHGALTNESHSVGIVMSAHPEDSHGGLVLISDLTGEDERHYPGQGRVRLIIRLDKEIRLDTEIFQDRERINGVDGLVRVQLIGHDEEDSTAALVEMRIRSLRQVYAIACIAHGGNPYIKRLRKEGLSVQSDFESYLPIDDTLLIKRAGQGSFWATVGVKAVATVKVAPKAALLALSIMFRDGPERIVRASEALVREREGIAEESAAKGRLAAAKAAEAEAESEATKAAADQARSREELTTEKQRFDLQKQRLDAYFDLRSKIDNIADTAEKAALSAALNRNIQNILGETSKEWLLPPSDLG